MMRSMKISILIIFITFDTRVSSLISIGETITDNNGLSATSSRTLLSSRLSLVSFEGGF
jgi:hypothetical protein